MAYATVEQLTEHLGRDVPGAEALLERASRDVDRALLCAVYDPTNPAILAALREATLEQVAVGLEAGHVTGTGVATGSRVGSFTLGKLSIQQSTSGDERPARIGTLWEQSWMVLQAAGLTGHAPQAR